MIRLFGGWHGYRAAPSVVVAEQIIVWQARLMAEAEQHQEQQDELDELRSKTY